MDNADKGGIYQSYRLLEKIENHFNSFKTPDTIGPPPGIWSLYTGYLYYLTPNCQSVGICVPEQCREEVERLGITLPVYYGYNTDPVYLVSCDDEDSVIKCMDQTGKLRITISF